MFGKEPNPLSPNWGAPLYPIEKIAYAHVHFGCRRGGSQTAGFRLALGARKQFEIPLKFWDQYLELLADNVGSVIVVDAELGDMISLSIGVIMLEAKAQGI